MIVSKRRLEPRMRPRVVDCIRFESCSQISLGDKSSQSPTPTPTDQRSKLLQPKGRRKSLFFSSSETDNLKSKLSPQRKSLLHKLQLNEKQLKEILVISEPQLVKYNHILMIEYSLCKRIKYTVYIILAFTLTFITLTFKAISSQILR